MMSLVTHAQVHVRDRASK